jgi:hypothetical protein
MSEMDISNTNQLRIWYSKGIKSQKSATKRVRNNLYYVLFGNILIFIFMMGMAAAHSNDQDADNSGAMIGGFLSLIIPAIGFFLLQSSKSELNDLINETISNVSKFMKKIIRTYSIHAKK